MIKQAEKEEVLQMSRHELYRKRLLDRVLDRMIRQKDVAEELKVCERHVRRLLRQYREHGPPGLISQRRGKPSNRKIAEEVKIRATTLVQVHYNDFKPTLANEKLRDIHQIKVSVETLRQWMIQAKIWHGKARRKFEAHQMRERRPRLGELIQIDGSSHDWFEGRGPSCTMILFIDDATSKSMCALFVPTETTEAYMTVLRYYIKKFGRPVALYADKHGIFHINDKDKLEEGLLTQLGRITKALDIELISAHSPQAKGRVERAFQTFQDRVVKEMRLAGVSSIEEGNAFLAKYLPEHNRRFAKPPRQKENAHRPVLHSQQDLDLIFSTHYQRVLSKNLSLQFKKVLYNVQVEGIGYALRGAKVTVCESACGNVTLLRNGKVLPYSTFRLGHFYENIEDTKTINARVDNTIAQQKKKPKWKPAPDHPWNSYYR
jgi:transposase